ncbi:diacylglycerol kinase family protein [Altererythrobacter sp. B11]|uniref:diacylglycerol kinase family protein n=1 Tax=Altererythrobacter sp. B11 TaxID=2060312 RepID=UPI000E5C02A4|nr:diacylglycerol kinase family protein [Altererythrobacter sp. B11]
MQDSSTIWLVTNPASGSNDEDAITALHECCGTAGFDVGRMIRFPDEDLPTAAELDAAGVELVAVFAGDGTINALISSLSGWSGAILVLEGGTMNLLFHRLHGDAAMDEVIAAVARGDARRTRPGLVRSAHGDALAGLLAGPGTAWNTVREAMREADVVRMADGAAEAIEQSVSGPMVACVEPALGRPEGYPLVMLTPRDDGMEVRGYHSETPADYLSQGLALLRRNFREGPHDYLGKVDRLLVANVANEAFGLSIDGEAQEAAPRELFELARCEVDLLATTRDAL